MTHPSIQYPSRYPGELLVAFARDLLDATGRIDAAGKAASADVVRAGRDGRGLIWLRHPDVVRAVLVDENDGVTKARGLRLTHSVLGLGLLTLEAPHHAPRRKLVLPAFHHQRLRAYTEVIVSQTHRAIAYSQPTADSARFRPVSDWGSKANRRFQLSERGASRVCDSPGQTQVEADAWTPGAPFDLVPSMSRLALAIASRTLFGADVDRARITAAVALGQRAFDGAQHPLGEVFARLPLPNTIRTRRARAAIDAEVYRVIAKHRAAEGRAARSGSTSPDDIASGDLLSLLLAARDEETGEGLTDPEARDEAVTLLLAGHETTAVALSWTWPLIAGHPEVEARLWAEVDALDGPPSFDDVRQLPYTRQVFAEAMRLYPPAWVIGRQAARDLDLDGVPVARGTTILLPSLAIHMDERLWPNPERLDPDRFAPERKAGRHKFASLPFSAGRRGCIGEQFAWTEGVLILATVAQRWRLRLAGPLPAPVGLVTLRPSGPIPVTAERR